MVHGNFVDVLADPNGSAGKRATEWRPRRIRAAAITAPTCSAFSDPHPHPTTTTPEKKESRKNGGKIISKPKIQIKVSHTLRRKRCDNSNRIHLNRIKPAQTPAPADPPPVLSPPPIPQCLAANLGAISGARVWEALDRGAARRVGFGFGARCCGLRGCWIELLRADL